MVIFTPGRNSGDLLPHVVGVFEDDTQLLRLAASFRPVESVRPRASGPIDSNDLALEVARLAATTTWDL
jgi:hypothetical protein